MRQTRQTVALGLLAVLAFRFGSAPAVAQLWPWPPSMSTAPAYPTTEDNVTITLSGEWPDTCVPNGSSLRWSRDSAVYFDLVWNHTPGGCAALMTPWAQAQSTGPLPVGAYVVYATLTDGYGLPMEPATHTGVFIVHPAWLEGDTNCDGVVNYGDINPFVIALSGQNAYDTQYPACRWMNADCNNDGCVSYGDINSFVTLLFSPHIEAYGHSGCLRQDRGDDLGCELDDTVSLSATSHTLHVLHENAEYNCCPDDITVALTAQGYFLRLDETEIATWPCPCYCCYSIESTVAALAPGTYTVQYCWRDFVSGPRCVTQQISVP